MEDDIPSISSGAVGSRFVSESEIDSAKARREEQWKAAYARLGQEPPPQPVEDVYDGRSLAEKLAANKAAKQEEWEEKMKLGNQFRALEEDEVMFLDTIRQQQLDDERQKRRIEGEELKSFREAVAARSSGANHPPPASIAGGSNAKDAIPTPTSTQKRETKKEAKKLLKGVVVRKKFKSTAPPSTNKPKGGERDASDINVSKDETRPSKKQKISSIGA